MSANKDINNMANQGEFHARVPPSHPVTTKGHAPGVKVGNDAYPEFHAQAYPPGTAPPEHTFSPNPSGGQWGADVDTTDTLPGATSADVDRGMGHPISGMSSKERHGRGKKERTGYVGVGVDARDPVKERRLDEERPVGARHTMSAEDRYPESAEELSAERDNQERQRRQHETRHELHQGHHEGHHGGHQGHTEGHHEGHHGGHHEGNPGGHGERHVEGFYESHRG